MARWFIQYPKLSVVFAFYELLESGTLLEGFDRLIAKTSGHAIRLSEANTGGLPGGGMNGGMPGMPGMMGGMPGMPGMHGMPGMPGMPGMG